MISFPFSALIWIRVKNVRSCWNPCSGFLLLLLLLLLLLVCLSFFLSFFCLNETAPVVCYEKKKANNPSLNNRAELKKKILAPGCPSASGPGIRLQLAQLHSLAQAIFSRKKKKKKKKRDTPPPPPPYSRKLWLHKYIRTYIFSGTHTHTHTHTKVDLSL